MGKTEKQFTKIPCFIIRVYQYLFRPLTGHCCRFIPSCSDYMLQAIQERGCCHGIGLGLLRLLRCHPFAQGGADPVPVPPAACREKKCQVS